MKRTFAVLALLALAIPLVGMARAQQREDTPGDAQRRQWCRTEFKGKTYEGKDLAARCEILSGWNLAILQGMIRGIREAFAAPPTTQEKKPGPTPQTGQERWMNENMYCPTCFTVAPPQKKPVPVFSKLDDGLFVRRDDGTWEKRYLSPVENSQIESRLTALEKRVAELEKSAYNVKVTYKSEECNMPLPNGGVTLINCPKFPDSPEKKP